ncbi:ABC transporter ATP-binding protein [Tepidanaerobacter syntrophicus]|uniref:Branched-chain amino acid transport system ATP-binding protein n=1 Tax=Tepidanaerobacter syntrophicus TaxID=224999 RepID=A0A0U9HEM6_9FIRM|nr:ABC transporter ATP-binding protein [Tepidanaerobacter syntrophicus]GAQ25273.1 branched-chain amino acid transport system ATP-binding protein [Tepidanaerobacter syntrophicus]
MSEQDVVLKIDHVVKRFGGITAVNDVSIRIAKQSIHGIIGPNGAGKTTLFNMITGIYNTTAGSIFFNGKKINGKQTHEIAELGIARTFQNIRLFNDLTVYQNLLTACQKNITYGLFDGFLRTSKCKTQEMSADKICKNMMIEVGLSEYKEQKAGNLPYGTQRRLEIARALLTNPSILLLDEPAAGMNEDESLQLSNFIKEIRLNNDITIIIIDHHMDVIMNICDLISVLNFGSLLAEGTPKEIQKNQRVIEAYLGVDE